MVAPGTVGVEGCPGPRVRWGPPLGGEWLSRMGVVGCKVADSGLGGYIPGGRRAPGVRARGKRMSTGEGGV